MPKAGMQITSAYVWCPFCNQDIPNPDRTGLSWNAKDLSSIMYGHCICTSCKKRLHGVSVTIDGMPFSEKTSEGEL